MDIFTAHPVLLWAVVGCLGAIALAVLWPILLGIVTAVFGGIGLAFVAVFGAFTYLFNIGWGFAAVAIMLALVFVTMLCFFA